MELKRIMIFEDGSLLIRQGDFFLCLDHKDIKLLSNELKKALSSAKLDKKDLIRIQQSFQMHH
jgi:hypothetical protein